MSSNLPQYKLISFISFLLPKKIKFFLQPIWYFFLIIFSYFKNGGRVFYNFKLSTFICSKKNINGKKRIYTSIRSWREFKAWAHFGEDNKYPLYFYLENLKKNDCIWSVGAANGIEGLWAHQVNGCKVVFIEPFAPSIESIQKSIFFLNKKKNSNNWYQIVQAAVNDNPDFIKFGTFGIPKAGEKFNSINEKNNLNVLCQDNRNKKKVSVQQWIKQVSLDELFINNKIPKPTMLIIDVDGYETKVIEGAKKLLGFKALKNLIIEINYNNGPKILPRMKKLGFKKIDKYVHHINKKNSAYDIFYKR
tara:strand:+ start:2932 stop:3846 length:915 start_codon:yes stop_codon:yes gene_type:complete